MTLNRYDRIYSLSTLLFRVSLDLCVCEDNLKIQNEVLKDAIEQVYKISNRLGELLRDVPSYLTLESEIDQHVECPKCDHEFSEYIYVSERVPTNYVLDLEFAGLEELA